MSVLTHRKRASGTTRQDADTAPVQPVLWVRQLLGRAVVGPQRQHLGHVRDVVACRCPDPAVTIVRGLLTDAGGHRWLVPASAVRDWQAERLALRDMPGHQPPCARRGHTIHLAEHVIGQPVLVSDGPPARVADIALRLTPDGWVAWLADTRSAVQRLLGSPRRVVGWDVLVSRRLVPALSG